MSAFNAQPSSIITIISKVIKLQRLHQNRQSFCVHNSNSNVIWDNIILCALSVFKWKLSRIKRSVFSIRFEEHLLYCPTVRIQWIMGGGCHLGSNIEYMKGRLFNFMTFSHKRFIYLAVTSYMLWVGVRSLAHSPFPYIENIDIGFKVGVYGEEKRIGIDSRLGAPLQVGRRFGGGQKRKPGVLLNKMNERAYRAESIMWPEPSERECARWRHIYLYYLLHSVDVFSWKWTRFRKIP